MTDELRARLEALGFRQRRQPGSMLGFYQDIKFTTQAHPHRGLLELAYDYVGRFTISHGTVEVSLEATAEEIAHALVGVYEKVHEQRESGNPPPDPVSRRLPRPAPKEPREPQLRLDLR